MINMIPTKIKLFIKYLFLILVFSAIVHAKPDTKTITWIENNIYTFLSDRNISKSDNKIKVNFNSASHDNIIQAPVTISCRKQGLITGKTVFTFSYSDKNNNESFQVVADISRFTNVPVLKNAVDRHHIISEADLAVQFVEVTWRGNDSPVSLNKAVGQRTKRYIPQGRVLTESMIETVPVIKRGDQVNMNVVNKNISLSIPVICQGKGAPGDVIKVRDAMSNKYYYAEIQNASIVIFKTNKR